MKVVFSGAMLLLAGGMVSPATPPALDTSPLDGVLRPSRTVQLGAARDGVLAEVLVDRGDRVEAGQVVAVLDDTLERVRLEIARARAASTSELEMARVRAADARRRLERHEPLREEGIITAEELDAVRSAARLEELALLKAEEDARLAELELERALAQVEQSRVRSSIDGVVTERHLSPGEYLSHTGGAELITVVRLDPLFVEVYVPAELRGELLVGESALVDVSLEGSELHSARVIAVDPVIDTASNTFRVRLELPNEHHALPAGLRCQVTFLH